MLKLTFLKKFGCCQFKNVPLFPCLVCTRQYSNHLTPINAFNAYNLLWNTSIIPTLRFGNWHIKRLPQWLSSKESARYAGSAEDVVLIPGLGRSSGEGHGNSLQYSCLEDPMDRGVWRAIVYRVTKRRTWLKQLSTAHKEDHFLHEITRLRNCGAINNRH